MLVFHSLDAVRHDTSNYFRQGTDLPHPESVARYLTLRDSALNAGHSLVEADDLGMAPLLAVHDAEYLSFLLGAWPATSIQT